MRFELRSVEASFLDSAPWRWVNVAELPARAAEVFALFEDGDAWPRWYPGLLRVEWTSPKPFGVGTTRTVVTDSVTVWEHFFRWEEGRRLSFFMTHSSLPLTRALAEDWLLEDLGPDRCRLTYVVAAEPTLLARALGPVVKWKFGKMFADATRSLGPFLAARSRG